MTDTCNQILTVLRPGSLAPGLRKPQRTPFCARSDRGGRGFGRGRIRGAPKLALFRHPEPSGPQLICRLGKYVAYQVAKGRQVCVSLGPLPPGVKLSPALGKVLLPWLNIEHVSDRRLRYHARRCAEASTMTGGLAFDASRPRMPLPPRQRDTSLSGPPHRFILLSFMLQGFLGHTLSRLDPILRVSRYL